MTQEDKELLLKDLCARLLYNVIVEYRGAKVNLTQYARSIRLKDCKPYLRPMSSMTEEEKTEYRNIAPGMERNYGIKFPTTNKIDWLNERHFDYRNLIERGLAIDCTGLNVY